MPEFGKATEPSDWGPGTLFFSVLAEAIFWGAALFEVSVVVVSLFWGVIASFFQCFSSLFL